MSPNQIKTWRKRLGLSQAEAAEVIGVSLRTLIRKEHGEQPISRTEELACMAVQLGHQSYRPPDD